MTSRTGAELAGRGRARRRGIADIIVSAVIYLPLALLLVGLASRSSSPVFLGKSSSLWKIIVALAVMQGVVFYGSRRLSAGVRKKKIGRAHV